MKQITMKELIALAYRGVEAMDADNAETKQTLAVMMNEVLTKEKQAQENQTNKKVATEKESNKPETKEDKNSK